MLGDLDGHGVSRRPRAGGDALMVEGTVARVESARKGRRSIADECDAWRRGADKFVNRALVMRAIDGRRGVRRCTLWIVR